MWTLLSPRVLAAVVVAVALSASHWKAYVMGKNTILSEWNAAITAQALETAKASEAARAKEQALQSQVRKVTNEYQAEKKRHAADAVLLAGRLLDFEAAITGADTTTTPGFDDPRATIASECAGAIVKVDEYAQGLAIQTRALQRYTDNVCINKD